MRGRHFTPSNPRTIPLLSVSMDARIYLFTEPTKRPQRERERERCRVCGPDWDRGKPPVSIAYHGSLVTITLVFKL